MLAGVLLPAGQMFEKWHTLEDVERFSELIFAFFKQGASRGAPSGESDFWKIASP